MGANNFVSKCWFMQYFPRHEYSQIVHEYSQIVSHISSKYKSQITTENLETRFFIHQIHLCFLRYPADFDCDASVLVVVSFLYDSIHSFHKVSYGGIQSGFKIVSLCCFGEFLIVKHNVCLSNVLIH